MPNKCRQVTEMIGGGYLPKVGDYIDSYNHQSKRIMGTISTRIDARNQDYVVVKTKNDPCSPIK